jgi:hypothetical protein
MTFPDVVFRALPPNFSVIANAVTGKRGSIMIIVKKKDR